MDKLTLGLIAVVGAIAAITFLGERKPDEEQPQSGSSIDPKMVIKPPRTGDEGMARQPNFQGDEGMVRRPPTNGGKQSI